MPEMRGSDLVVEYLIKEKVPYLFGYAGHGAVGLLKGVEVEGTMSRRDPLARKGRRDLPAPPLGSR